MTCSHPVIYTDERGEYCHVCKARLGGNGAPDSQAKKDPPEAEKPQEAAKKAAEEEAAKKAAEEETAKRAVKRTVKKSK